MNTPLCQVCAKCQKFFHLTLIATLDDGHHYSHFTDEEAEA